MFLIEVESCFQFRGRGTIKLISLVRGAMLLQDRDAGIITRIGFYQSLWVYEGKKAHMHGFATYLPRRFNSQSQEMSLVQKQERR